MANTIKLKSIQCSLCGKKVAKILTHCKLTHSRADSEKLASTLVRAHVARKVAGISLSELREYACVKYGVEDLRYFALRDFLEEFCLLRTDEAAEDLEMAHRLIVKLGMKNAAKKRSSGLPVASPVTNKEDEVIVVTPVKRNIKQELVHVSDESDIESDGTEEEEEMPQPEPKTKPTRSPLKRSPLTPRSATRTGASLRASTVTRSPQTCSQEPEPSTSTAATFKREALPPTPDSVNRPEYHARRNLASGFGSDQRRVTGRSVRGRYNPRNPRNCNYRGFYHPYKYNSNHNTS